MAFILVSSIACICGLVLLVLQLRNVGRRPKGLPPGPPTLPILGNLHQLPKRGIHLTLQKWAKEYGPIYSIMLGTQITIMINKAEVAKELLEKRSAIWSSRPELYMAMNVMGSGLRFNLMVSQIMSRKCMLAVSESFYVLINQWTHSHTETNGA